MENNDYIQQNGTLWYTRYFSVGPQQGWQCPCCKTVHAPWVQSCECEKVSPKVTVNIPSDTPADYWLKETDPISITPETTG